MKKWDALHSPGINLTLLILFSTVDQKGAPFT